MQLTICAWDERVFNVEIDPDETIDNLKAILEVESGVPIGGQSLYGNGRLLNNNSETLKAAGIGAGDMLMLHKEQAQQQSQHHLAGSARGQPRSSAQPGRTYLGNSGNPALELAADGSAVAPAALVLAIKADSTLLGWLRTHFLPLAQAIQEENLGRVQELLRQSHAAQLERQRQLQHEEELADADPFDSDVQRRIEELIQKKNIEDNYLAAMEDSPEVFAQVEMLYINLVVKHAHTLPMQAFVDSGAQMTIMTVDFAQKCHLGRLMDTLYAGVAVGVGSTKIVGRIHQAPLLVAGHHTTTSITVLEQKDGPQFIFGLDMLRRHQCTINLRRGMLEFGSCDAVLPFLNDSEIPRDFKRHVEETSEQDADQRMRNADADSFSSPAAHTSSAQATGAASAPSTPGAAAAAAAAARAAAFSTADPAVPSAATTQQPPGGGVDESKVQLLLGLGFARTQCIQALQQTGGDADAACAILFGGF